MTTRRLGTGLLLAVVTALSVSACGAGLDAQTYQQRIQAETSDASVGQLALRNIGVEAPSEGAVYEVGDDATAIITVTNSGDEPDTLVEVTSSAASEVVVLAFGEEGGDLVVPGLGSTGDFVTLELRGLTRSLRTGEYVDLTFRFEDNGSTQVLAPIALTGETDRPVYTGEYEEGGEEPALQGPAGGHGEGEGAE